MITKNGLRRVWEYRGETMVKVGKQERRKDVKRSASKVFRKRC